MDNHVHFLGQRYQKLTKFNGVFEINHTVGRFFRRSMCKSKHKLLHELDFRPARVIRL